jgi:hypothetical protein
VESFVSMKILVTGKFTDKTPLDPSSPYPASKGEVPAWYWLLIELLAKILSLLGARITE